MTNVKMAVGLALACASTMSAATPVLATVTGTALEGSAVLEAGAAVTMTFTIDMNAPRMNMSFPPFQSSTSFGHVASFNAGSLAITAAADYNQTISNTVGQQTFGSNARWDFDANASMYYSFYVVDNAIPLSLFSSTRDVLDVNQLNSAVASASSLNATYGYQVGIESSHITLRDVRIVFANDASEVPEPASVVLIGLGLAGLAASRRRKV